MGKCVAYVAAAAVFFGIGALVGGLCTAYLAPHLQQTSATVKVPKWRYAECDIQSTGVKGTVYLKQSNIGTDRGLHIAGNITGLTEGPHGFHIHQWGVPTNKDCVGCGGHYNPKNVTHGGPTHDERHVGDLGNINTTEIVTQVQIVDHMASLWGDNSVVGRAIVIHAQGDDLGLVDNDGSKSTGNAGGRVACCTIFLVKK